MSYPQRHLLTGPVIPLTLRLAGPGLLALFLSSLSILLDGLLLSRTPACSSAAGLCFPLITLTQTVGFTLGTGSGSLLSQRLGRGCPKSACAAAFFSCAACIALLGVLCLLGCLFPVRLLSLLGGHALDPAPLIPYLRLLLLSSLPMGLSLVLSSLLRGLAHTGSVFAAFCAGVLPSAAASLFLYARGALTLTLSGILILLRECLILLTLFLLWRFHRPPVSLHPTAVSRSDVASLLRYGAPTLLRQGTLLAAHTLFSRRTAALGHSVLSGSGLALRLTALLTSCIIGFLQGLQPVCGANSAAGQMQRVRRAARFCAVFLFVSLSLTGILLFTLSPALCIRFFPDATARTSAVRLLRAQALVLPAQGLCILTNVLSQSSGHAFRACVSSAARPLLMLLVLLLFAPSLGASGPAASIFLSDLIALPLCLLSVCGLFPARPSSLPDRFPRFLSFFSRSGN